MLVTKTFRLTFDEPSPGWLCPDNLKLALEQVCTHTVFGVEEVSCDPPWDGWPHGAEKDDEVREAYGMAVDGLFRSVRNFNEAQKDGKREIEILYEGPVRAWSAAVIALNRIHPDR